MDIRERKCRLQSPLLAFSLWKCRAESAFLRILNIPLGVPSCPPTSYPFPPLRSLAVWLWGPRGTTTSPSPAAPTHKLSPLILRLALLKNKPYHRSPLGQFQGPHVPAPPLYCTDSRVLITVWAGKTNHTGVLRCQKTQSWEWVGISKQESPERIPLKKMRALLNTDLRGLLDSLSHLPVLKRHWYLLAQPVLEAPIARNEATPLPLRLKLRS